MPNVFSHLAELKPPFIAAFTIVQRAKIFYLRVTVVSI